MGVVRQTIKSACGALVPRRMFMVQGPGCSPKGRSSGRVCDVALTFDDGPDPGHTPKLLELLDKYQIKATFFLIGEKAARHRGVVQQIAAAGHALGNHSYSHAEPCQTTTAVFLDEIRRTRDLLETISNRPCTLVRPPKGVLSAGKQLGLWRLRMTIALWNVDPRDYSMHSRQQALTWGAAYRPRAGDIVLLHDNHPWATPIVQSVSRFRGHAGGVRFVRLSDWLQ